MSNDCVKDVGHNQAGNTEASLPALGQPGCAEWQSTGGYGRCARPAWLPVRWNFG